MHLSYLHFKVDFLLLKLVLKLLLPLLGLVKCDFLLEGIVFHLLVLEKERLDLAVKLLEHHFVLLHHQVHICLVLCRLTGLLQPVLLLLKGLS